MKRKKKSALAHLNFAKQNLSGQEIQDEIFRKMNADKKILVGSQLWRLAKTLAGEKINYGINRPKASSGRHRKNS